MTGGPPRVLRDGPDSRGVATLTLNRPEVHNAYDGPMLDALDAALATLAANPTTRVLVLRAAGKHFQAGADVAWLKRVAAFTAEENLAVSRRTTEAMAALARFPHPTLCLVQGACHGGGVGLVASCDIAVAAADARFALTEVRVGVVPAPILPQLLAAIGTRAVQRYGLTGEVFDAPEARRIGLVQILAEDGDLDAAARAALDGLLAGGPAALSATKALVAGRARTAPDAVEIAALAQAAAERRASPEAAEGLSAFLEKRQARWVPAADR